MIIFAFVLVVFLFLFSLIATQRAQTLSSQLFSQEQLVAQSIAAQMDTALQAGNGYTARVPITGDVGTLAYQLLITKNGEVIVNASVGSQAIQAYAFSTVKNVASSSSYLQPGTFYYNLPIANGTLYIQNSFGTICVDYNCPNASVQAANVSLSSQSAHAALFNGQTSVITVADTPALRFASSPFSYSAWLYENSHSDCQSMLSKLGSSSGYEFRYCGASDVLELLIGDGSSYAYVQSSSVVLREGAWYYVVITNNGNNQVCFYINGALLGGSCVSYAKTYSASSNPVLIGQENGAGSTYWNGGMSNVQVYNAVLSSSQVQSLYSQGITSPPILAANVIGWWPLNGNANDYSGQGNNGVVSGPLLFTTVAELFANVTNQAGYAIANDLVGFTTTLGNLNGNAHATSNYTNTAGIAVAFLTQNLTNGQAVVKATAYNGNTALDGNLIGWWPLNLGQGNAASDASGGGSSGSLLGGAGWGNPNSVADFDGNTSYIAPANTALLQPSSAITYSAWIDPQYESTASGTAGRCQRVMQNGADGGGGWQMDFDCGSSPSTAADCAVHTSSGNSGSSNSITPSLVLGKWYMVTCEYNSVTNVVSTYLNGVLAQSYTYSGGAITYGGTAVPYIGTDDSKKSGQYFSGGMADAQVYNSLLTQSQLQQLYQQGVSGVPPTNAGLVGWWPLAGDALDYSGDGLNGTIYGNLGFTASPTTTGAISNSSGVLAASFNAVSGGSYVSVPLSGSLNVASDIAVSIWLIPSNIVQSDALQMNYGSGGGYTMYIRSTGVAGFSAQNQAFPSTAQALQANTLYNLVGTYDGSTFKIFVNGVYDGSLSLATTFNNIGPLEIGRGNDGAFVGNVLNVQVYSTTLNSNQIAQIYSRGAEGAPISNTSLVGWWPLNGNANDYSGRGNNGTASNVMYYSHTVSLPAQPSVFAGTGVSLNGQNGYIKVPQYVNPTAAFTVTAWMKAGYSSGSPSILYHGYVGSSAGFDFRMENGGELACGVNGGGGNARYDSTGSYADSRWHFVACTFLSGQYVTTYADGAVASTGSASGIGSVANSNPFYIGADGTANDYLNGTLADVQLYNIPLTQPQIQQLYNAQSPPSAYALIPLSWSP